MAAFKTIAFRAILAIVAVAMIGLLYILFGDHSGQRDRVLRAASDAMGMHITSSGSFDLDVGRLTSLTAVDVDIANSGEAEDSYHIRLGSVRAVVDTWSLRSGTVVIESIAIDNASVSKHDGISANLSFSGSALINTSNRRPDIEVTLIVSEASIPGNDSSDAAETDDAAEDDSLVVPNTPLELSWLQDFDLTADVKVAEAFVAGERIHDLTLLASVANGSLDVQQLSYAANEGSFTGSLQLAPAGTGYSMTLESTLDAVRLYMLADDEQDPSTVPPFDMTLQLAGSGESLHAILATANGQISGRQGSGQLNLQALNALFSDVIASVLQTLNPLSQSKVYSDIECGIADISIVDGVASIEQLAVQSDRLSLVSSGKIELATEELDLALQAKPRQGLGISVGGVANSFFKLGGTLRSPSLDVDAAGSLTTTGAAVATGGLSLLAKGLWDRVSSEVNICKPTEEE